MSTIRLLETPEEMTAVEELQRAVWSGSETEIVPAHLLITAVHNGGVLLGAGYAVGGIGGGTEFWMVLLGVGFIGGAGIGFGYVVPIAVGMRPLLRVYYDPAPAIVGVAHNGTSVDLTVSGTAGLSGRTPRRGPSA